MSYHDLLNVSKLIKNKEIIYGYSRLSNPDATRP